MGYFRKKPVEIEAVRWCGCDIGLTNGKTGHEERLEVVPWMPTCSAVFEVSTGDDTKCPVDMIPAIGSITRVGDYLFIGTREGTHRADPGDWIIRGVKGELYPCKPDIFGLTYDRVNR